ncbi:alpha-L-rhamnosidase [Actinobacteria bacterium YIM 96077]|uniref:alpha-L-rhamnosidase n=1 Tax=Phytoactinopolyspora halophila TaxID=1981511 RepID=A0A329QI47_9ACTN|nr:family 78 glycoside hydrolase catalytic domain [Phytoactinopolyspora halophila]AYY12411.1 alpha-L-rhamnosidase [Actinobacteria bacterium YIM 96077]RAW12010.1 alpha-L-rhamnosidase [Phytoactinopolyspora halophila]
MNAPTHLRVEHLDQPIGLTCRNPRLSWRLPADAREQLAYQVRAGEWDSGKVESSSSVLVPYRGRALDSAERVHWTVRVWTDAGVSDWAEPSWWETGLLSPEDWTARWIEPLEDDHVRHSTPRPAYLFRHVVTLEDTIDSARLYVTAHGIYEVFINGVRVGDAELTPGFTSYPTTLQVQTYDVTELLLPGENAIGAIVSDGWFRGQNGGLRLTNLYGDSIALLAQLNVHHTDGLVTSVGTGPDWTCRTGEIKAADLIQGQAVDLRRRINGWCTPGAAPEGWSPVVVGEYDLERLRGPSAPPVRRVEEIRPVEITEPRPGVRVVDLGQNINGWVRMTNLGPAGTRLTLTYGEALDAYGDVTQENMLVVGIETDPTFDDPEFANLSAPFQTDQVTSAGEPGETFEPRHTTHGFRYVRVEGHQGELTPDDVTGVVVHTDMRRTGWFECSDDRLNRLHEAAVWSFRGNACDIPTDCPTRERAGWTGDWQIFVGAAAFIYDVAGFSTKWLYDLVSEQRGDGRVSSCVPETISSWYANKLGFAHGSAGWGDAAVVVPWEIYRAYGDVGILAEQYDSMMAWVDYGVRAANERRHEDRVAKRVTPLDHERWLWDTGYHWGEWLEPDTWDPGIMAKLADTDHSEVATAYLHRSARLLAETSLLLDEYEYAGWYAGVAAATRLAWQTEFIDASGSLVVDSQASHVRALAFDLVPEKLRAQTARRLVDLIRKSGTHLTTGFLSTPYLLPVLAETGYPNVAYELLFQSTEPSWLTMIDRDATTIWEDWGGVDENGYALLSLNHYSKGAVISFLHRYVGGIKLLDDGPGYCRFEISPMPGGGLTWANTQHESPYGLLRSGWQIDDGTFVLDITVPPGTNARVVLPDGQTFEAEPGQARYTCAI